ncbi:MAG TPA: hypothetical protein VFX49_17015 [Chloroflexota bacterium]|nr:hypothetical protein [Chloroflexota bacterium]
MPTLVVVPCGQRKIWDDHPQHGPAAARDAYTGTLFVLNRTYAERFGDDWLILSAKYGFIAPDFIIPSPYNVTFKHHKTNPISLDELVQQQRQLALGRYTNVVALGGADYRHAVRLAFASTSVALAFPTAGLPIGKAMQAVRHALDGGSPLSAVALARQAK